MTITLTEAVTKLDPSNDEHWTSNGSPRMDVIHELTGNSSYTRKQLTDAFPKLTRETSVPLGEGGAIEQPTPAEDAQAKFDEAAKAQTDEQMPMASETKEPAPVQEPIPEEAELAPVPTEIETIEAQRDELGVLMLEAQKRQRAAKVEADDLADQVNALNRKLEHLHQADPNHATKGIRAYLDQQNANRQARARGLSKFIELTGIAPKDAAIAVDPRAKIDQTMKARKTIRAPMQVR